MSGRWFGARGWRGAGAWVAAAALGGGMALGQAPGVSSGGPYVLGGQGVGGAATLAGGAFRLHGAVRAPAGVSTGVDHVLAAGVLEQVAVALGEYRLEIRVLTTGAAEITWPAEAAGFALEAAGALGPEADWQPVSPAPAGSVHVAEPSGGARFFRLRRL